ncbi:D-glycerate 3-kinase [Sphingomonas laterariae]|uniref:D-glycerate 3-kinase n=1 Tax=Edaphosphingomonas laterariae TaxID=861865 RepID=A0A239FGT8_9SPHN|nr:kinase [Sphingomonas laterariae]SNS55392.1 D-glycerate 3-kinase [Sphingomonas laterariae]
MSDRADPAARDALIAAIGPALAGRAGSMLVVGLCGAQGSGKSTLAAALAGHFNAAGTPTAILSLDDLYLPRAERLALAAAEHPLLATRGVPGTHDIALGRQVIAALRRGEAAPLPRFDKATDDRRPPATWDCAPAHCALLILEGWCVGARPQPEDALAAPVNALERDEDADGRWRRFVNTALAADYQRLFAEIDLLALLAAPDFAVVRDWRAEQEAALRAATRDAPGLMDDGQIARFVAHYERLTRHVLTEMPPRADLVVALDRNRAAVRISRR